jgi:hypothetical protein
MSSLGSNISLFVLVECDPYSSHRDPKGVYKVELVEEKSLLHCACAAVQLVKDYAPFVEENIDKATLRVFSDDGSEIKIATFVDPQHLEMGLFQGRADDFPESITVQ